MNGTARLRVPSVLLGFALLIMGGCGKAKAPEVDAAGADRSAGVRSSRDKADVAALLTKEEVGAVIGQPVTSVEGRAGHLIYKTDVMLLQATIEIDRKRGVTDAIQAMQGARTATGFLGGAPEAVPGLGDEAIFGAMSTLYLRKGSDFILIQPPNLQMIAGQKAGEKLRQAKMGSDEWLKAMEELKQVQQTDPVNAGLQGGDAVQGALAVVKASSKKQGTQYETDARAMAVALATKLLEKL